MPQASPVVPGDVLANAAFPCGENSVLAGSKSGEYTYGFSWYPAYAAPEKAF